MKRFITLIVSTIILSILGQAVCAIGNNSDTIEQNSIRIKHISVEDILSCESAAQLDDLVYPSVKCLPTRYLDLGMMADISEDEVYVGENIYKLLEIYYPSDDGMYTWAECYSAVMYFHWLELNDLVLDGSADYTQRSDIAAFNEMITSVGVNLADDITNIKITNFDSFRSVIQSYSNFLSSEFSGSMYEDSSYIADDNTGIIISLGLRGYNLCGTTEEPVGLDMQDVTKWFSSRASYIAIFGLVPETSDISIIYSGANSDANKANQDYSNGVVVDGIYYSQTSEYVGEFSSDIATDFLPNGNIGMRDIALSVAVLLVIACIIVFIIIDTVKRINDPMRKWKWRWR